MSYQGANCLRSTEGINMQIYEFTKLLYLVKRSHGSPQGYNLQ
jgi:hypothetical protein